MDDGVQGVGGATSQRDLQATVRTWAFTLNEKRHHGEF